MTPSHDKFEICLDGVQDGIREQFPLEMVICFVLSGVRVRCFDGDGFVFGLSYFGSLMPCDGIRISLVQRIGQLGANGGTKLVFSDRCYMQQMFQSLS